MTRDEAMKLDAGPELDALIATKIMGWLQHSRNTAHWADFDGVGYKVMGWTCGLDRWSPSTDIAAAFQIWPILYKRWGSVALCQDPDGMWTCMNHDAIGATYGYGPTECVALCRAGILEFFDRRD